MRDWTLGPGDPLDLVLAADFRLCNPDYANDHVWELELGGGESGSMALHTTYGLRARLMRIFPRFILGDQIVTAPSGFSTPPRLREFFPNFLALDFFPFRDVEVAAEYWIPDSHTAAGRFIIHNRRAESLSLALELCGQLVPLEGQSFAPTTMQSVNVLSGRSADLSPVLLLTGGPHSGASPYPSLALDIPLLAGEKRTFTWAEAALADPLDSFDLARHTAACPWEAEQVRIEMIHTAQTVEIRTGDPDWDAAFAFTQKAAFSLFLGTGGDLPRVSFLPSRQPDHGPNAPAALLREPSSLEAYFLSGLLPGAPQLGIELLHNFLPTSTGEESESGESSVTGRRGNWPVAPLLASLAWKNYQRTGEVDFLRRVWLQLMTFYQQWFDRQHDRDQDGFPEWDHAPQMGLEDVPAFTLWVKDSQGAEISATESPGLAALLLREARSLGQIAGTLGISSVGEEIERRVRELSILVEECWEEKAQLYHHRDRDTHSSPRGKALKECRRCGRYTVDKSFRQPTRLLVRIDLNGGTTRRPEVILYGQSGTELVTDRLVRADFRWGPSQAVAMVNNLYTRLQDIEVSGVEGADRVSVRVVDYSDEDISLFLPLWAGVPRPGRAQAIVEQTLFAEARFGKKNGVPACAPVETSLDPATDLVRQAVHIPWNTLIGEGLLAYGLRKEAAELTARLMQAVIQNLKQQRAFAKAYHAETGAGIGERDALQGLAPLGLFLETLGVQIRSPKRVVLSGKNPFPWPVTVQYKGLTVIRQAERTEVVFPDGQIVVVDDPSEAEVSVD